MINILAPDLPESIVNATIITWRKKPGDLVSRDEILVEIETDKVILEVPALTNGILDTVLEDEGSIVVSHQILGYMREDNNPDKEFISAKHQHDLLEEQSMLTLNSAILTKYELEAANVNKEDNDSSKYIEKITAKASPKEEVKSSIEQRISSLNEERVPMTSLRKCIAERLLKAKNTTATLTTFNEVNMKPIVNLIKQHNEKFKKQHGIRLGFMSFYVKVVEEALKRYPKVNASIDGDDIVYHNYFDVNIAISTPRGLVTPVLNNIDTMSMADIEKKIKELAVKGRNGKLTIEDLTGGNFTITNGGVFGSLISTPIINPPQSAILGIHAIKDRPMAINGKIKILPMMYLALSYDHRLIDGCESIGFLVTIKELLEDPVRLLLNI